MAPKFEAGGPRAEILPPELPPPVRKPQPNQNGRVDLSSRYLEGYIEVRLAVGKSIAEVMVARGLGNRAEHAVNRKFTLADKRSGLDRVFQIPVPRGTEKQMVRLLSRFTSDFESVNMVWEPDVKVLQAPIDPRYGSQQNYLSWVNMEAAWDRAIGSTAVRIAVLDSGLKADHEDFSCPTPGSYPSCGKQYPGWDYVSTPVGGVEVAPGLMTDGTTEGQTTSLCFDGHGTQVTSIAAANTNNSYGYAGTGWNAAIIPIKVLSPDCTYAPRLSTGGADRAGPILKAIDLGAHVINMSYDLGVVFNQAEQNAIQQAWNSGIITVVAAGNDNTDLDAEPHYPCAYDYVICIGGVQGAAGQRWVDSPSFGSNYAGATYRVDFTAPSSGICGAIAQSWLYACATHGGTSYAAPIVSGVLALLRACGNTPQQQFDALVARAKGPWTDPTLGRITSHFGLIDAGASLWWAPCGTGSLVATYSSSPPTSWNAGQSRTYSVTVTNSGSSVWAAGGANPVRLGIHFGTNSDVVGDGWATDQRFALPTDLSPGGQLTLTVTVSPPASTSNYVLRHRMVKEGIAWFEQIQRTNVSVSGSSACSSAGISANPPDPSHLGNVITFYGTASPCPSAIYQFVFWDQVSWYVAQDWSSSSAYLWATAGYRAKAYYWVVNVRADYTTGTQASAAMWFGLQDPCSAISVSTSLPDPQPRGSLVTFYPASSGCQVPEYRFWIWDHVNWALIRDWSTSPSYTWDTTPWKGGSYLWQIDARGDNVGGSVIGVWKWFGVQDPCSSVTLSGSPSGSASVGTAVSLHATSTGNCMVPQYQFIVWNGSSWSTVQAWNPAQDAVWSTAGLTPGWYYLRVDVRGDDVGGAQFNSAFWYYLN